MREIDVKPTCEIIKDASLVLRKYANELNHIAQKMEESNDFGYTSSAVEAITNCFSNLRLDLLVTRPIREYRRLIEENKA